MWKINIEDDALKIFKKLDKPIRNQILKYFDKIISSNENPKSFGKPLVANRSGLWRYRVGDYRIICDIKDSELLILVLEIGHRSEIYE